MTTRTVTVVASDGGVLGVITFTADPVEGIADVSMHDEDGTTVLGLTAEELAELIAVANAAHTELTE